MFKFVLPSSWYRVITSGVLEPEKCSKAWYLMNQLSLRLVRYGTSITQNRFMSQYLDP